MQRFRLPRRATFAAPVPRTLASSLLVGLGLWLGFPTVAAYQDMTSMVSGLEGQGERWATVIETSVAGSVQAAEMPFADAGAQTASLSGAGVTMPGLGKIAFRSAKAAAASSPDEDRVNRADKQDRLVTVAPVAPPKAFTAGSVLDRTSSLLHPGFDAELKMAFAKPAILGEEIQIASAFHAVAPKKPDAGMPSYLANLVTSEKADILATAYAPAEPDYAKASPFETLLQDPDPTGGRFIPPAQPGDHSWIETPLPASVFSEKEQRCLATAVYFEARGESTRGQAAVAQVVLNRVRNPAYPNSICEVVYQNEHLKNRCQFSFACDGVKDRIGSPQHYRRAQEVAMAVTAGKIFLPEVGSSTHYYAQYVSPGWARAMNKMTKIGLHIFYRTRGGGWN